MEYFFGISKIDGNLGKKEFERDENGMEEDFLKVAQKYLFPQKSILVVVANLKEAGVD